MQQNLNPSYQSILDVRAVEAISRSLGIPTPEFIWLITTDLHMVWLGELVEDLFPDLWNDGLAGCQDQQEA